MKNLLVSLAAMLGVLFDEGAKRQRNKMKHPAGRRD
jgi:hypothetical protein